MKIIHLLLLCFFISCLSQNKLSKEEYLNIITTNTITTFDDKFFSNLDLDRTSESFEKIDSVINNNLTAIKKLETIEDDFNLKSESIQILMLLKNLTKKALLLTSQVESSVSQSNENSIDIDSINNEFEKLKEFIDESKLIYNDVLEMIKKDEEFKQNIKDFCSFHKIKIPDYIQN